MGGATVVATSSSGTTVRNTAFFRRVFEDYGGAGSRLVLAPCNGASKRDVDALVRYIYAAPKPGKKGKGGGLGLDLDFVIPFAAISQVGLDITGIGSRAELAARLMLTNTVRLLGAVAAAKKERNVTCRPALCVLPLSPNHGVFGGDGPSQCRGTPDLTTKALRLHTATAWMLTAAESVD